MCGKGVYKYGGNFAGKIYTGEMKDGKPHGTGTMKFTKNISYKGEFKNGLMDGQGVMTHKDGNVFEGTFE